MICHNAFIHCFCRRLVKTLESRSFCSKVKLRIIQMKSGLSQEVVTVTLTQPSPTLTRMSAVQCIIIKNEVTCSGETSNQASMLEIWHWSTTSAKCRCFIGFWFIKVAADRKKETKGESLQRQQSNYVNKKWKRGQELQWMLLIFCNIGIKQRSEFNLSLGIKDVTFEHKLKV